MNHKGMALVEIMVSMIVLAVTGLAVTATMFVVNSKEMRMARNDVDLTKNRGGSLDIQALGYARETLELLKNAVSTDGTRGGPLVVSTNSYITTTSLPDSFKNAPVSGTRTYLVSSVAGTDLKKVKVTVQWTD